MILGGFTTLLQGIAKESPFRLGSRLCVKYLPLNIEIKAKWDVVSRPQYLTGLVHAAREAKASKADAICAIEFGVAAGAGLLELQRYAVEVGKHFGLRIDVVGFDMGSGLPDLCADYRDHPDLWAPGDYPMDDQLLRNKLLPQTKLIIGDIAETLEVFINTQQQAPVGFVSFDMDLYSSTRAALKIFTLPGKRNLRRVTLYFDDVYTAIYHHAAGEYLAIREFNDAKGAVFIDKWHNVKIDRPFPEAFWTNKMYIAHDLDAISRFDAGGRAALHLPLP